MLRVGVVGYGKGGRHIHMLFIDAAKNCKLSGIVARSDLELPAERELKKIYFQGWLRVGC
jgi:predicted dehydrogenase